MTAVEHGLRGRIASASVSDPDLERPRPEHDLGPHPVRSLSLSTLVHFVVAFLLSLLPSHWTPANSRERRGSLASIEVQVARAPVPIEWSEERETLEPVESEPLEALTPPEFDEPDIDPNAWFDEAETIAVRPELPPPPTAPRFDEMPDDLFLQRDPVADPVEETPEPVAEPESAPAEEEAVEPEPEERPESEAAPEVDGEVDEEPPQEGGDDADDAEEREGDTRAGARLEDAPVPRYPIAAKRMGKQGTVTLAIDVDPRGRIVAVHIRESSGHRVLDEAARQCVMQKWSFVADPAEDEVRTYVERIVFRLTTS